MMKNILFIQGGGEGAHEADKKLATSLRDLLGDEYNVRYPKMPNETDPEYEAYKIQISKELARLDGKIILVGHSLGGTVLLRYLTEEKVEKPIVGIFLVATPYWGVEDWFDAHSLHKNLTSQFPNTPPLFFYHSRDDDIVPFAHLAMYSERFPLATFREFDGRGHQFNDDLSEVAVDIISL